MVFLLVYCFFFFPWMQPSCPCCSCLSPPCSGRYLVGRATSALEERKENVCGLHCSGSITFQRQNLMHWDSKRLLTPTAKFTLYLKYLSSPFTYRDKIVLRWSRSAGNFMNLWHGARCSSWTDFIQLKDFSFLCSHCAPPGILWDDTEVCGFTFGLKDLLDPHRVIFFVYFSPREKNSAFIFSVFSAFLTSFPCYRGEQTFSPAEPSTQSS